MRLWQLCMAASAILVGAGCNQQIQLPVTVKTTKGEIFRGEAKGPPFSGTVTLATQRGVVCVGNYSTSMSRVITVEEIRCDDGRTASFTATLEPDLVSAKGVAKLSDGTAAVVAVGKFAGALEELASSQSPSKVRYTSIDAAAYEVGMRMAASAICNTSADSGAALAMTLLRMQRELGVRAEDIITLSDRHSENMVYLAKNSPTYRAEICTRARLLPRG